MVNKASVVCAVHAELVFEVMAQFKQVLRRSVVLLSSKCMTSVQPASDVHCT